jgi:uracil-DNA glycosylase
MTPPIPPAWQPVLADETEKPYFAKLQSFLQAERAAHTVYPPEPDVFNALKLTPFEQVSVLILGQDPYHGAGQAHGLAFSVQPGVPPPPSLLNIYRELKTDVGFRIPNNGYLVPWTKQGVLLLNAVLTVRAGEAGSHQGKGWENFTDEVIRALSARAKPVVFVLWGNFARKKLALIDQERNPVIEGVHPSPLSAQRGFFGSRPFSRINTHLRAANRPEINWQLPNI